MKSSNTAWRLCAWAGACVRCIAVFLSLTGLSWGWSHHNIPTPTSRCMANCGQPAPPPPPVAPPKPKIGTFGGVQFLPRCEVLTITDLDKLSALLQRLRNDAFADAFDGFVIELKALESDMRRISNSMADTAEACNSESLRFDQDARDWNRSDCVSGVPEDRWAACSSRQDALSSRRAARYAMYQTLSDKTRALEREFETVASGSGAPIRNAINVLNPDPGATEQAFRLYVRHVVEFDGSPPRNSCRAFARIASALGRRIADPTLFLNMLARNVVDPASLTRYLSGSSAGRPFASRTFNATGFKPKFVDSMEDNQVRHAAGFMLLGYRSHTQTAPQLVSLINDVLRKQKGKVEAGDYYLAISGAQLGVRLAGDRYTTRVYGDEMQRELCN